MNKRYTEEQVIGFLKEAEAGTPVKELCAGMAFPKLAITRGGINSAAWTSPTPSV